MTKTEMIEKFEKAMNDGDYIFSDFMEICRKIGVSPCKMNGALRDIVGFNGEEVVKSYKFNLPFHLL